MDIILPWNQAVYYSYEHDNFYAVGNRHGQGNEFYVANIRAMRDYAVACGMKPVSAVDRPPPLSIDLPKEFRAAGFAADADEYPRNAVGHMTFAYASSLMSLLSPARVP